MRSSVLLACVVAATFLGGCSSYSLVKPEQLYHSQTYLPMPRDYVPEGYESDPEVAAKFDSLGRGDSGCADPQVIWRDPIGGSRGTLQLAPGMTLRVVETTYRRNDASGLPVLSEWQWTLPRTGKCGGDLHWGRDDLLKVRHLLSGAVVKSTEGTPDTDYYLRAIRWAGCPTLDGSGIPGPCSFGFVRDRFLEPLISSLEIRYRDSGLNYKQAEPYAPSDVMVTPLVGTNLAAWFGAVNAVRSADFFRFQTTGDTASMDIAQLCSRLSRRRVAAPIFLDGPRPDAARRRAFTEDGHGFSTVDLAACNFTLKRLSFIRPVGWPTSGGPPLPGSELVLLTSGDPLLLFRPPAQANVLDSSSRHLCAPTTPGNASQECTEEQRLGQGFVDFDVLIDVKIDSESGPLHVPPTTTVEQFEKLLADGRKVTTLLRNTVWIPKKLRTVKSWLGPETTIEIDTVNLAEGRFFEMRFADDAAEVWRRRRGVFVKNSLKSQIILAPGDVLTLTR